MNKRIKKKLASRHNYWHYKDFKQVTTKSPSLRKLALMNRRGNFDKFKRNDDCGWSWIDSPNTKPYDNLYGCTFLPRNNPYRHESSAGYIGFFRGSWEGSSRAYERENKVTFGGIY